MTRELLTPAEAAVFLRFERPDGTPNVKALYAAVRTHRMPVCHRGRRLLFDLNDLRAWVRDNAMTEPASTTLRLVRRSRGETAGMRL